jgi:hypothetical protein
VKLIFPTIAGGFIEFQANSGWQMGNSGALCCIMLLRGLSTSEWLLACALLVPSKTADIDFYVRTHHDEVLSPRASLIISPLNLFARDFDYFDFPGLFSVP